MGRTRGNQHALAGEAAPCRARSMRSAAAAISSGSAIRPMPASPASAISPALGPITRTPSARKLRDIALASLWPPHPRVHRRRQQDRPVGREQDRGGEIVGMAVRHLRHQVGGRRRHHDQIGVARETDMAGIEFALGIEQIGVGALADSAPAASAVTNCCAAWVSTQRTCSAAPSAAGSGRAPCRRRCRRR